ncbi:MAG: hypothetical protein V4722_07270 [Bacteroidota bacterium]
MTPRLEILLEALKCYEIEVISITGKRVKLQGNFEIEVEANGMYKLMDDGYVVAPFGDLNELCRFILM